MAMSTVNADDNRAAFKPAKGEIPTSPGVYRFSDRHGRVLYIGKAKNLRNRVSNYFQPFERLQPRTQQMLRLAAAVDWTVVSTDTESLLLEHTWITRYKPPYNVVFKDDKSYPYLAVTLASEAPRLIVTRNEKIRGAKYFGPYPKVRMLKQTLQLLQQVFPIRTCNDADYKRAIESKKPCLSGQIGRCNGPCSQRVTVAEHRETVNQLLQFLNSPSPGLAKEFRREMLAAAEAHDFERAALYRDRIQALEQLMEQNSVVLSLDTNADLFGLYGDEFAAAVHQFIVRGGRILGERSWVVDLDVADSQESLMSAVLQTAYTDREPPQTIYVSLPPADSEAVQQLLAAKRPRGGKVSIKQPARGDKLRLLNAAVKNAGENLTRHRLKRTNDLTSRTDALAELQAAIGMEVPPLRIECIDVSHLQGTNVVASLVVFEDGLPAKGAYRKYKIAKTSDDTDSIYQVVKRRATQILAAQNELELKELGRYRDRPQLLIVDGGKPQVAAAARALSEVGITDIALCGIAKRLEELWLQDDEFPVILPRNSEALYLVQRARDEAHRFAITFQRQQRSKGIRTKLDEIPGLGQTRISALLKHFGSVKRLAAASEEEIAAVPGIGAVLAAAIAKALR